MATVDSVDLGAADSQTKTADAGGVGPDDRAAAAAAEASPAAAADRRREIDATIDSVGDMAPSGAARPPTES